MENVIENKVFLSSADICKLFGCSQTRSYDIINRINFKLEKRGFETIRGKVLARALYETYGMVEENDRYLEHFTEKSKKKN